MSEMTYKVLVACEESQTVCKAFRARGFEAYSCDIQEPSGGHPEWHILGDALKAIRKACISAHLPFDSATPEGKRVMDALYAVWKVKKRGKEA